MMSRITLAPNGKFHVNFVQQETGHFVFQRSSQLRHFRSEIRQRGGNRHSGEYGRVGGSGRRGRVGVIG